MNLAKFGECKILVKKDRNLGINIFRMEYNKD